MFESFNVPGLYVAVQAVLSGPGGGVLGVTAVTFTLQRERFSSICPDIAKEFNKYNSDSDSDPAE